MKFMSFNNVYMTLMDFFIYICMEIMRRMNEVHFPDYRKMDFLY